MASKSKQSSSTGARNQMNLFKEPEPEKQEQAVKAPELTVADITPPTLEEKIPRCPRCKAQAKASLREPGKYYCIGLPACTEGDDVFRFTL
jgi:hypothetical protein